MELGGVNMSVAFLAGVVSCFSPCVLPLAPIYVSSLVGGSTGGAAIRQQAPLLHAAAFMAGFVLLFTALGFRLAWSGTCCRTSCRCWRR